MICLNDNLPTFSVYANDMSYETAFAEPLVSLSELGDIAMGFSASGNSPSVLRAMETAHSRGLATVGFTGSSGGHLQHLVQIHVHILSNSFGPAEDLHLAMAHAICERLRLQPA